MKRQVRVYVAMAALAASVSASVPAAGATPDHRLFMVADSVALGAAPAIRGALAGWQVAIEGHQGIFTGDAAELAWSHRDEIGAIAAVGTGYNYPVWNPPLFDAWIDQMMGRLVDAGARHVLWLTLREPPLGDHDIVSVWEKGHIADHYPEANRQLRAATTRWPQLTLVDWNAAARGPGLTWDGLHLAPAGQSLMADLIADGVDGIGRLPAGETLRVPVGVGAAAALNLTVTWPRADGYLTAWPCDEARPLTSNLNFTRHQTVANLAVSRLAQDGSLCIVTSQDTHVVVDLEGTFAPGSGIETINPVRVLDTRTLTSGRPAPGSTVRLPIAGIAGVPRDALAVVATITATDATGPGYVTAWPCDGQRPTASTVNYSPGAATAGLTVVPFATDGSICLFAYAGTHLVVDVAGWLSSSASVRPVTPTRLVDTRATGLRLAPGGVVAVDAPGGATAVAVTVIAADPGAAGYLTAFPCGRTPPLASTLNYLAGEVVANLALVGVGADGRVCVASSAAADVVVDLVAWFPTGAGYAPVVPLRLVDTRSRT